MSFLNAEWRKLIFVNYKIDKILLEDFVPSGTELDMWHGATFISLIGFGFVNTRLLGIKVPFHVDFEEVNLRFYVKRFENLEWKRGVVFIREIVPKPALTFVANTFYKEKYETLPMRSEIFEWNNLLNVKYSWKKEKLWNHIGVSASPKRIKIEDGSEAEFITEHYWGYSKVGKDRTVEYEVRHPKWEVYNVESYDIKVDFGLTYGQEFAFLDDMKPTSVMLAEGSEISVENKTVLHIE